MVVFLVYKAGLLLKFLMLMLHVGSPVFTKVGVLTEFLSTYITHKGFLASVSSLVCTQI